MKSVDADLQTSFISSLLLNERNLLQSISNANSFIESFRKIRSLAASVEDWFRRIPRSTLVSAVEHERFQELNVTSG